MTRQNAKSTGSQPPKRYARGFVKTGGVLSQRIRTASEKRGFAETRLLTQWAEIVGPDTAAISRPVKIGYGRQGFGATLTLLTNGANAPMLQADLPRIQARVNACYGYAAISHIRLTQTAETGFGPGFQEGQTMSTAATPAEKPTIDPAKDQALLSNLAGVESEGLRSALAALGRNILTRSND